MKSTAARDWDGDGISAVCNLLDTAQGDVANLLSRPVVEQAVVRCLAGRPRGTDHKILQQFSYLAVASSTLDPASVVPSTGRGYERLDAAARRAEKGVPAHLAALAVRLSFVKRTRVGRRVWKAVRSQVVGRATPDERR